MRPVFYVFAILILFASCEETTIDLPLPADEFPYPAEVGFWVEYDVYQVAVDVRTDYYDTIRYRLREEVDALLDSTESEQSCRVLRSVRYEGTDVWEVLDAVMLTVGKSNIIVQADNVPLQKLQLPLEQYKEWDVNAYNGDAEKYVYVDEVMQVFENDSLVIDSVATIHYESYESAIDYGLSYEQYAPRIGLVYKEAVEIDSQNITFDEFGEPTSVLDRVEVGSFYYQSYVRSGMY